MKSGWQTKKLVEVCQFSNGLWKGENPPFMNVGVIRNTNFTKEGTLDDSDIAYLDVEVKKFEKRRLQYGDVILEKSGGGPKQPVGRVVLFDKTEGYFSFSNFTSTLRVLDPNSLDFHFLHMFLHWTYLSGITEGMQSHSTGIRNLDGNAYKAIEITFPKLPEQQRIIGILDEAFDGIATAKANIGKNLQNARELFESYLDGVFANPGENWEEKKLGDILKLEYGKPLPASKRTPNGKYPIYGANGEINRTDEYYHDRQSIIVGRKGSAGEINFTENKFWPLDVTYFVTFNDKTYDLNFVFYLLRNLNLPRLAKGVKPGINRNEVYAISTLTPPLTEQQAIAANLNALSSETNILEGIYEQKLAALEDLKKSLLEQAFTGEL